ncbi:site-specific integrase [Pedobacter jamesrossensis]|uniref:Site-specific integrase n=1 Tax=Pedobacter jamesrossensis TaxID=1908238 RepID=A0ABV8NQH8_9SPHI
MISVRYKELKSGKFSAYLDIYMKSDGKGKRNYEFLSIYVHKDYSNPKARVMEVDKENFKLLQAIRNARETELNFSAHGYEVPGKVNYNLLDYVDDCLNKKFNYKLECLNIHLHRYVEDKHTTFSDVNVEFLENFQKYLLTKVSQNTTSAYMGVFRQYYNKLITKGYIKSSAFSEFKAVEEEYLERTTLTIDEVRTLAKSVPKRGNSQVRHAFLFSCFTGLRYSDVRKITFDEIQDGHIVFRPQKTIRKIVRIPLTEQVKEIIKEVEVHPINRKIFWDLPTGQVTNMYLKFWGLEAGITKNMHFHAARHTFATIGLTFGIDLYTMKELLGHSKIEMTQIYAKIVDKKKEEELTKFPKL